MHLGAVRRFRFEQRRNKATKRNGLMSDFELLLRQRLNRLTEVPAEFRLPFVALFDRLAEGEWRLARGLAEHIATVADGKLNNEGAKARSE
jgi:hypothetical protein